VLCVALLAGAIWLTLGVVSAPPPAALVAVPDLSGMSQEEATAKLRDTRLTLGTVTTIESKDELKDRIVNQRPSSRTQVTQNSAVNLEIGLGLSMATVPDLVGLTSEDARRALDDANLEYKEVSAPSLDPDKGKAIQQDPAPQAQATPNSTVTVTIGSGMTIVAVPDGLIGTKVDDATAALQASGLTVVTEEADGTEPRNQVIGADHQPGQQLPSGSPVTLRYSNNSLMIMPSLQNQTPDQAAATLISQGWAGNASTLTRTEQPTTTREQIGAVITQNPAAGSTVRKIGTPVSVGIGAMRMTVPNMVGRTRDQAARLLDQAGATSVTFADAGTPPRGQANRVQGQSLPPNSIVPVGTPITVNVYRN
jgi:serine/threonine-protein kinase